MLLDSMTAVLIDEESNFIIDTTKLTFRNRTEIESIDLMFEIVN